jgi:outer membrane protein
MQNVTSSFQRNIAIYLGTFFLGGMLVAPAQTDTPVTTNNGTAPSVATPSTPGVPQAETPAAAQSSAPSNSQATPAGVVPRIRELPNTLETSEEATVPADAPALTVAEAEAIALKNNPSINIAQLTALAQGQMTREARAAYMPTLNGMFTGAQAEDGSRLTAGALNNPVLYTRAAFGVTLNQMLTDFGRTRALVASASLQTKAAESTLAATRQDIIFAVDTAFYRALGAQTLIAVAQQDVRTRRTTANQISALTNARLRSTLDLNFANADLAQAQLQLLDARNMSIEAQATLSALLGDEQSKVYRLMDDTSAAPVAPPAEAAPLVTQAFQSRPDLQSLMQTASAQHENAKAERDLSLPTISALGATGDAPTHASAITQDFYGAIGVNVTVPIFNGFLYSARANVAKLQASAADQQVRKLREAIARDVTTTVLQAQSNFNRIAVAQQLSQQADQALQLAQTRYKLGLSSIVELSQAQLLQTQAAIQYTSARYAYEGSLSAIRYQTGQ